MVCGNLRLEMKKDSVYKIITECLGGARGVMVIVVGNGHGDKSSNPGQDWLHLA